MRKWKRRRQREKDPPKVINNADSDKNNTVQTPQPKILSPGYNIYISLKSITIDSAFEQACVSSQVEPNYLETP